ncbi:two pore domain potassium channel family protein [Planococcus glaciei]|uniref:Two pore domain potassium channel family protein n=1 Tax=Planococcus glaciei TaxID=459472 RepID=A0A7H8QE07_9BACL|nr:potassium channel family protein [Planococcus glaciei]ETP69393.1 hypothetical protein G159_07360 [Planococcus glaciei CHR43]QKX52109.1 two pore domain potassium channel family protein [Planococcus glaciei]
MSEIYIIIGALLLLLGIMDFIWTTLWVDGGAGPLTEHLSHALWKVLWKMSRNYPKILSLSGPLILSMTLLMWIVLLWTGWTFVFAGNDQAIIHAQDKSPATWPERIYFTGYLIFTLGNGDFSPQGTVWQIATVCATGTGMLFITLGVTYLLSVLGAVTQKRAFAESVYGAGKTSAELVKNSWNGHNFHNVDFLLSKYSSQLSSITAQHKAYPILHHYYAEDKKEAVPLAVTILDEALTIFFYGIQLESQPNRLLVMEARSSIKSYLDTLYSAKIKPSNEVPPYSDLEELHNEGFPTVTKQEFLDSLEELEDRRKKLLGIIQYNALQWPK